MAVLDTLADAPMDEVLAACDREREQIAQVEEACKARRARLDEIERLAAGLESPKAPSNGKPKNKSLTVTALRQALPPALRTQDRTAPPREHQRLRTTRSERVALVLGLIRELEPVSPRALRGRSNLIDSELGPILRELRDANIVQTTGKTNGTRYHLTATLDRQTAERNGRDDDPRGLHRRRCREDVLLTIRNEPGQWTEARIADSRDWDRELVAGVCGALLAEGKVELMPDGTYRPLVTVTFRGAA